METRFTKKPFSLQKRILSFKFAIQGIAYMLKTQHNLWIHLFATLVVVCAGFIFDVSTVEWIILSIMIGAVFTAEAFNTAIELMVDKISPEYNKTAGLIKDVSAGAVLIIAIAAVVTGLLIFAPKIFGL